MDSNRLAYEYTVGEVDDCGEDEEEDMPMSWVDIDIEANATPPDNEPAGYNTADIDARSINQETTKKLWEDQIASGEVALFPRPDNRKKSISTHDVTDFKSEVESEPLNLNDVKKQWERKAEEVAKEKDERDRKLSTSKSYDSLSMGNGKAMGGVGGGGGLVSSSQSYDSLSKVSSGQRLLSSGPGEVDKVDNSKMYESAIDREIRLTEERENELKREKESRMSEHHRETRAEPAAVHASYQSLPQTASTKITTAQEKHTQIKHHPQQQELSPQQKESIIEREIREQERREEQLRHEGQLPSPHHTNKEHEQSEYERQEKEQERISAHESIVEREIRLQREREQEISKLRSTVYKVPSSEPDEVDSVFLPPQNAQADTNGHSVFVAEQHIEEPQVKANPAPTQRSTPSANAPGMTTSISYEDAISTYAHAGESMIARELREQKEREEELRRRWREELGIESPLQNSEPDTPYNMPDPVQPRFQQQRSVQKSTSEPPRGRTPENGVSAVENDSQVQRKSSRVQPLAVEDDRDPYRYVPQYETPIEREIRLAREREAEFRQMKGLGAEQTLKSDQQVVLDVKAEGPVVRPQILHRKGDEPVQEKATMKRLAHSRLQQEIEVERQRELDLQRLGHISTLSDDRKGDPARYVDVVAKESSPVTPTTTQAVSSSPAPVEEIESPSTLVRKVTKSPVDRSGQRSMGELKIEQELREMREREEELRSLRLATSHRVAVPGEKPTSNGTVVHVTQDEEQQRPSPPRSGAPGDTLSKGPRRKTNLAAEWEKKISGSS